MAAVLIAGLAGLVFWAPERLERLLDRVEELEDQVAILERMAR